MSLAVTFSELPQLFALFSPLWFLLVLVSSGLMIWSLDKNRGGWATVTAALTIGVMVFLGEQEFPGWVYNHPKHFLAIIGVYFIAGAIWGVGKWFLFVKKRREKYDDAKASWLRSKGAATDPSQEKEVPEDLKAEWKKFLEQDPDWCVMIREPVKDESRSRYEEGNYWRQKYTEKSVLRIKPFARENKARIAAWMTYWPWSLCWAMLDDLVHHVFRMIQQQLSDWMDRIATRVFKGIEKDFADPTPPTPPTSPAGIVGPTNSPSNQPVNN